MDVFVKESLMFVACAWDGIEIWNLPNTIQPINLVLVVLYTILSVFAFSLFLIPIIIQRRRKKDIM
jgi:hypothetical protein